MADRSSLGILGYVFGSITALVMVMAFLVVIGHVEGRMTLEAAPAPIVQR
jgi:phage-related holin